MIRVLGPVEAEIDGKPVDLGGRQQRAVLARLLVARGEVVSVDRLIDDLWNGQPPPSATGALQAYISNLRRTLEPQRRPRAPAQVLMSAAPGYAVRLPEQQLDAWRFEQLVRTVSGSRDADASCLQLREALALWNGAAFAEFATQRWAAPETARLEQLRFVAREDLIEAELSTGRAAEASVDAERLVHDAPFREEGWRLLALAQYASARQADALATLRRARATLVGELGVDPGAALVELERAILEHSVQLPRGQMPPTVAGPFTSSPHRSKSASFIGRRAELEAMRDAASAVAAQVPGLVLVSGEAGIGKSALLTRTRDELAAQGWRTVFGRCSEVEGAPPALAWSSALRELAGVVDPGPFSEPLAALLTDDDTRSTDVGPTGRFRLHSAVGDWFDSLADRPFAVFLDDLHRADAETGRLLVSLLDRRPSTRLLFVVAYRQEPSAVLDELLGELARHAPVRVALDGLDGADAADIMTVASGFPVTSRALAVAIEQSDGNPFFLCEIGRLIASEGEQNAIGVVPQGVSEIVRRRIARLPDETVTVLRQASIVGRVVDVDVLIDASTAEEEAVLVALEAGVIGGLLIDDIPGQVRFAHILVREALYESIPLVRRTAWHAAIASSLERLRPSDVAAFAHHAAQSAVPTTGEHAAAVCVAAAEQAESRYSYDAAAELYAQALTCLELAQASVRSRCEVLRRRLPALIIAGRIDEIRPARTALLDAARGAGDPHVLTDALVAGALPSPWADRSYRDVDADFVAELDRALDGADLTRRQRCLLLVSRVRETALTDDPRTDPAADVALALARAEADPELVALALIAKSETVLAERDVVSYAAICDELAQIADAHELLVYQMVAALKQAECALVRIDVETARSRAEVAEVLAHKLQIQRGRTRSGLIRGSALHAMGDLHGARQVFDEALKTYMLYEARDGVVVEMLTRALLATSTGTGLAELVEPLQFLFEYEVDAGSHVWAGLLAAALVERGDVERAQSFAAQFPSDVPDDALRVLWCAWQAYAVASLASVEACARVYPELAQYTGLLVGGAAGLITLPVDWFLGRVAVVLKRPDDARAHFSSAREIATRCANAVWLARIEEEQALLDA